MLRTYKYKYIQITHVKPDFNIPDQGIFSHFKYFNSLYVVIGNSLLFYCVLTLITHSNYTVFFLNLYTDIFNIFNGACYLRWH